MADSITQEFPDYDVLLATCRMNPRIEEYELTEKSFPQLIEQQFEHGHIPDTMLEDFGFPKDQDMDGKEVRRDATISQEARQRAKCLTHKQQVKLRRELIAKHDAAEKKKEAQNSSKMQHHLNKNKECEVKLIQLLHDAESGVTKQKKRQTKVKQAQPAPPPVVIVPRNTPPLPGPNSCSPHHLNFECLTLEIMANCVAALLHSFVYVRQCENMDKSCKIPKTKGTVEQAKEKENEYLLGVAFKVRNKEVVLKLPLPSQMLVPQQQEQRYQNATIIQSSVGAFLQHHSY
jgi:hypothetical protein